MSPSSKKAAKLAKGVVVRVLETADWEGEERERVSHGGGDEERSTSTTHHSLVASRHF